MGPHRPRLQVQDPRLGFRTVETDHDRTCLVGYDYVVSYEHEDVVMSREDGIEKTIEYLKPLIIKGRYEGRGDKLFLLDSQGLPPHHSGKFRDHHKGNSQDCIVEVWAQSSSQSHGQDKRSKR